FGSRLLSSGSPDGQRNGWRRLTGRWTNCTPSAQSRVGTCRSGVEALTARELRVAQLAAQGHSNADIAPLAFVPYKTVGSHLGHVYQKLDVTRPGLAEALAGKPGASARPQRPAEPPATVG